jgi:exosome complex component RRP42
MDEGLRAHALKCLKDKKRSDGRGLVDYREPITVTHGVSKTAEGSAQVQIGGTIVMAGVKLSVEKPYPDTPEQGSIMVNVELLPLSSPEYEPGPPGIYAVELARVVDRGIREAKAIDLKKLCIKKGENVWIVMIDVVTINDAGNLFDAMSLAALAALKDTVFPTFKDGELDYKTKSKTKLPLEKEPIAVTVYRVGSSLIVDPSIDEEKVYDARLTVTTTPDGAISALQKGGDAPITVEDVAAMVDLATEKAKFLREKL